jgi:hypothetical protein
VFGFWELGIYGEWSWLSDPLALRRSMQPKVPQDNEEMVRPCLSRAKREPINKTKRYAEQEAVARMAEGKEEVPISGLDQPGLGVLQVTYETNSIILMQ